MEADHKKGLLLRFPHKRIRAEVIKEYLRGKGFRGVVCFSCGNASAELRRAGLRVLDISERGDLQARRWFDPGEIAETFRGWFDGTAGHLSAEVMNLLSAAYRDYLGDDIPERNYIPTGSGETIVCLKIAYPDKKFIAVYNLNAATRYEEGAVLNGLVRAVAEAVIK